MYEKLTRRKMLELEGYNIEEAKVLAEVASNLIIGRKHLYFMDHDKCEDFINKYKGVFIGDYKIEEIESSKGLLYCIHFATNHADAYEIYEKENTVYMTYRPQRNGKPSGPRVKRRFIC